VSWLYDRSSGGRVATSSRMGASSTSSSNLSVVEALLQPVRDGQIERLDHVAAIGFCGGLADEEQVVELPADNSP
jgi:hypothetical protein